ncbi:MAG TPA: PAS domain S-box protein, partial [Burkholderiales bacterium]|nr:PAS domain S-box protein [Burkholderiales bacterium]
MEQEGKRGRRTPFLTRFHALYAHLVVYLVLGFFWFGLTSAILLYLDDDGGVTEHPLLHIAEDVLIVVFGIALFLVTTRQLSRRINEHLAETAAARLAAIVDNSDDAIISRGLDLRIRSWNPAAERLFGYTAEEAIGQDISLIIPPEFRDEVARNRKLLAEGHLLKTYDTVRLTKDGRRVNVSLTLSPMKNRAGEVVGNSLIARDITERKHGEERIERLSRFYAALSETNEAIMRTKDRQELFDRVCSIAVDKAGLALAWVCGVNTEDNSVRAVAAAGTEAGYVEGACERIRRSLTTGSGPTAAAIRENQPQILNYYADATAAPWRTDAERHGIHSSAVIPITEGGKVMGCLNLYARELGFFDDELMQLLREIAENLSFALDNFAREEQRELAEHLVRESEARYRLLIQHFPDGVVLLFDRDMRFQIADGKGFVQLGIDPQACIGSSLREAMPADLCDAVEPYCRRALTGRAGELALSACGRHWSIQVLPVQDDAG